jgi:hypothetical protein
MALTLMLATTGGAAAGPYSASQSVATPGGINTNFAQLKQITGFTGQMAFSYSDGGYTLIGNSFIKTVKLRFTVDCPANYRVHEAGIRVRGADVANYDHELVSPGDVPFDQNSWQATFDQEPWNFDAAQASGIQALDAAGNNGPVYVSLDEELDSRTEFYASCSPSQPSSGLPFIYYDSYEDSGHLRPMTRVRYQLQVGIAKSRQLKAKPEARRAGVAERLRHRDRAAPAAQTKALLKTPGGCPYDCPPPAPRLRIKN